MSEVITWLQNNQHLTARQRWQYCQNNWLSSVRDFDLDLKTYHHIYQSQQISHPVWLADSTQASSTNLSLAAAELNLESVPALFQFSKEKRTDFWQYVINKLSIRLQKPYQTIMSGDIKQPHWLTGAKLNIAESCFNAPGDKIALIAYHADQTQEKISYQQLRKLANRVAHSLMKKGFAPGDFVAIDMSMTIEAVAIYLGVILAGGAVVSIADSFAPDEIATRLRIAPCKFIFTQDVLLRNDKPLPLYEKVCLANAPCAIVIPMQKELSLKLRTQDISWLNFLVTDDQNYAIARNPEDSSNILFSSGTTGDPKAIPWTHTTGIKCASDAWFHLNLKNDDIITWPTNLGWMMGPWLIYAGLINQASIALYYDAPLGNGFGQFIQDTQVTVLGLVPSLVNTWRSSRCMEAFDWRSIKLFASTGECSNAEDMFYLMWLAHYKPVIEYCGGTEIGGAYITSTVLDDNIPATFSTPAIGLDFVLLDEQQHETHSGEVALVPPSIGLSNSLLNREHESVYFAGMPVQNGVTLRRHGDEIVRLANGYFQALGRVDDTMNLGGIKTSSADIERVVNSVSGIRETAAIAITPAGGGPSQLVIYAVATTDCPETSVLQQQMQQQIKSNLNPLFKIHQVIMTAQLPRTASNKVMRRVLRDHYISEHIKAS